MKKLKGRARRHKILRRKIAGTTEKPRLCVFRSGKNMYAQLVDDVKGHTLLSVSTNGKAVKNKIQYGGNVKAASLLGEEFAKRAKEKGNWSNLPIFGWCWMEKRCWKWKT